MIKRPLDQAQEAICPGAYLYSRVGASRPRGRSQLYVYTVGILAAPAACDPRNK